MFGWVKKLWSGGTRDEPASQTTAVQPCLTVEDVMDDFLEQNPQPTPYVIHALIAAGAHRLSDSDAVVRVCEKIAHHGYQYPLNPTMRRQLKHKELLEFLRWQAGSEVERESYRDENTVGELIRRFRQQR